MTAEEMLEENARDAVHKVRCGKASPELAVELAGHIQGLFDLMETKLQAKDREWQRKLDEAVRDEAREADSHRREAERLEGQLTKTKKELESLQARVRALSQG